VVAGHAEEGPQWGLLCAWRKEGVANGIIPLEEEAMRSDELRVGHCVQR
jgi:hypothetical protein